MKKTNVALFHSATRWVRYLPLLLCFIAFSSSDLAAQNFKSPEDAAIAVKEALEQVVGDLDPTVDKYDELTPSESRDIKTFTYYSKYLDGLKELQDVEAAFNRMDKMFPVNKMDNGDPNGAIGQLRDDLLDLITQ
jgi:hypothetical protein